MSIVLHRTSLVMRKKVCRRTRTIWSSAVLPSPASGAHQPLSYAKSSLLGGGKPDTFFATTYLFFLLAPMYTLGTTTSQRPCSTSRSTRARTWPIQTGKKRSWKLCVRLLPMTTHACVSPARFWCIHIFFLHSLSAISFFSFLFSFPPLALLAAAAHSLARVAYLCSLANNPTQNGPRPFVTAG